MTSMSGILTLDDNPPLPVVEITPAHVPGARDVTVADWPFGPGPMPPTPRSYPAVPERREGLVVVERIIGQAWSTGIARVNHRGTRYVFRFESPRVSWRP